MATYNDRILYIEPNDLQAPGHDNVPFNMEDLQFACNLEVEIPSRYDCCGAIKGTKKKISFFGGTDGKLTTSYTDISGLNGNLEGNKETLGVTSINIEYTSYYMPEVTINFCDVRGSALMQPQEEGYKATLADSGQTLTQGSFFRALFTTPYPLFTLKVKGYFGRVVTYNLAVNNFKSTFNAESGNFDIVVKFIGYMYGPYTDIPLSYLVLAPYCTYGGANNYWANNTKENGKFTFTDGTPMCTLTELMERIDSSNDNVTKYLAGTNTAKQLAKNKAKLADLKKIHKLYDSLVLSMNENTNAKTAVEGDKYILIIDRSKNNINTARINALTYNSLIEAIRKFNSTYKAEIKVNWEKCDESNPVFPVSTIFTLKENSKRIQKDSWELANGITFSDDESFKNGTAKQKIVHIFNTGKYRSLNTIEGYLFDKNNLIGTILHPRQIDKLINDITIANEKLEESLGNDKKQQLVKLLGFTPSAKNVIKLIFAHLETFMHMVYGCCQNIGNSQRTFNDVGLSPKNTDIPETATRDMVPPFPLVRSNSDSCIIYPEELGSDMEEIDLVNSLVFAGEGNLKKGIASKKDYNYIPTLISDIFKSKNPYIKAKNGTENLIGDILIMFVNRLMWLCNVQNLGMYLKDENSTIEDDKYQAKDSDAIKSFAEEEAYNVFNAFRFNEDIKNKMNSDVLSKAIDFLCGKSLGDNETSGLYGEVKTPYYMVNGAQGILKESKQDNSSLYSYNLLQDRNFINIDNLKELETLLKDKLKTEFENSFNMYPLTDALGEMYENLKPVFSIQDNLDREISQYLNNLESIKSDIQYTKDDKVYSIFRNIDDDFYKYYPVLENGYNCTLTSKELNSEKGVSNVGYQCILPREINDDVHGMLKNRNGYVYSISFNPEINGSNEYSNSLFGSLMYNIQDNIYAKAYLFLLSLPIDFEKVLKLPYDNTITQVPNVAALLLGAIIGCHEGDFTLSYPEGYATADIPLLEITYEGGRDLFGGIKKAEETGKSYIEESEYERLFGLKYTVKRQLIDRFKEWVNSWYSKNITKILPFGQLTEEQFRKIQQVYFDIQKSASIIKVEAESEEEINDLNIIVRFKMNNIPGSKETVEQSRTIKVSELGGVTTIGDNNIYEKYKGNSGEIILYTKTITEIDVRNCNGCIISYLDDEGFIKDEETIKRELISDITNKEKLDDKLKVTKVHRNEIIGVNFNESDCPAFTDKTKYFIFFSGLKKEIMYSFGVTQNAKDENCTVSELGFNYELLTSNGSAVFNLLLDNTYLISCGKVSKQNTEADIERYEIVDFNYGTESFNSIDIKNRKCTGKRTIYQEDTLGKTNILKYILNNHEGPSIVYYQKDDGKYYINPDEEEFEISFNNDHTITCSLGDVSYYGWAFSGNTDITNVNRVQNAYFIYNDGTGLKWAKTYEEITIRADYILDKICLTGALKSKVGNFILYNNMNNTASSYDGSDISNEYKYSTGIIFHITASTQGSASSKVENGKNITGGNLQLAIDTFNDTLKRLYAKQKSSEESNTTIDTSNISVDLKFSTYLVLKSLYDKWLSAIPEEKWDISKDNSEFNRFKFLDTYFNNIEDDLLINLEHFSDRINTLLENSMDDNKDTSAPSVYQFIQFINQDSGCILIESPAFGEFQSDDDFLDAFKPLPFNQAGQATSTNSSFLWLYTQAPSSHLDIEGSEYCTDGFDMADTLGNISPTLPSVLYDGNKLCKIPAFGVSFGRQNQSMFKGYQINMDNAQQTDISIANTLNIADSFGAQPQVLNYLTQDLYRVYSNYAFQVTVEMMGDASIAPMMYFQLNNVPMFKGTYWIYNVKHSITPENMTTTFTGMRVNKTKLPLVKYPVEVADILSRVQEEETISEVPQANIIDSTIRDYSYAIYDTGVTTFLYADAIERSNNNPGTTKTFSGLFANIPLSIGDDGYTILYTDEDSNDTVKSKNDSVIKKLKDLITFENSTDEAIKAAIGRFEPNFLCLIYAIANTAKNKGLKVCINNISENATSNKNWINSDHYIGTRKYFTREVDGRMQGYSYAMDMTASMDATSSTVAETSSTNDGGTYTLFDIIAMEYTDYITELILVNDKRNGVKETEYVHLSSYGQNVTNHGIYMAERQENANGVELLKEYVPVSKAGKHNSSIATFCDKDTDKDNTGDTLDLYYNFDTTFGKRYVGTVMELAYNWKTVNSTLASYGTYNKNNFADIIKTKTNQYNEMMRKYRDSSDIRG